MNKEIIKTIFRKNYLLIVLIFILFSITLITNNFFIEELTSFDRNILTFINTNLQNDFMTNVMKTITFFGSYISLITIIIIFFLFLKNKKISIFMAYNLLIVYFSNVILKHIFERSRPSFSLVIEKGFSLPSSHAMCSIAFYGLLIYFIKKYTQNNYLKYIFITFLTILIILIGFSRIYLNVHYFSDVIIGFAFGLLYLLLFIKIINIINEE